MYVCQLCKTYASFSCASLLKHIGTVHSHEAGFSVTCGIDGCPATFTNYHAFRRHLRKKHPHIVESQSTVTTQDDGRQEPDLSSMHQDSEGVKSSLPHSDDAHSDERKLTAMYILKLKEKHHLSQTTVDDILQDTEEVATRQVERLHQQLTSVMKKAGLNPEEVPGFEQAFEDPEIRHPFDGLHTEHRQNKFYRENMGLVEPVEITLGRDDKIYYIPILQSLECLLNDNHVLEEVCRTHKREDGFLSDFYDGELYCNNPLFSRDKEALMILLYNDDIEICNPLGSHRSVHKMSMFYYLLANISPQYRSQIKAIQLVCVAPSSAVTNHGVDAILEPFVEDVKKLEKGVSFTIGKQEMEFRGSIATTSADNLASQMLGGYKQLASALRRCRFCMAHRDDMDKLFTPTAFQPRTRATHSRHVAHLGDPVLASALATTYGLTRDSILNSLQFYHIIDGLPPDIMHDILEGALQYEVKEMLQVFIEKNYFSLDALHKIFQEFKYGYTDVKNKATTIHLFSLDHKLGLEAAEMWCFARLLPIMIGQKVPTGDEHWETYLDLLTIVDYVFAPVITPNIVALLHDMIRNHHECFCRLYPGKTIIPKQHYMIHIPEWILKVGPLSRHWCMRFEAKHSYFKRLAKNSWNFRNIAKTLANRHQRLMCYYLNSSDQGRGLLEETVSTGRGVLQLMLQSLPDMTPEKPAYTLSRLEINSLCYKQGGIVVLKAEETDVPVFGEIKSVVVVDVDQYFLVVSQLETLCFSAHFHAYEVAHPCTQLELITPNKLADCHPLSLYKIGNGQFVPLKYFVITTS